MTTATTPQPRPVLDPCALAPLERLLAHHTGLRPLSHQFRAAFDLLIDTFQSGHKVLVCGNGGSAADAGHIVAELMKGMTRHRRLPPKEINAIRALNDQDIADYLIEHLEPAAPVIDLGSQPILLTAVGNDTAGDMGFAQQVQGYGHPSDLLWALSTSGRSRNAVLAAAVARAKGVSVLAFTGASDSPLARLADITIRAPAQAVQEIQELHQPIYHTLCEMIENILFGTCPHQPRDTPPTLEPAPPRRHHPHRQESQMR